MHVCIQEYAVTNKNYCCYCRKQRRLLHLLEKLDVPTPSSSPLPPATDGVPSSSPHLLAHSISSSPLLPPMPSSPSSPLPPDDSHYSPPPRAQVDRTVPANSTSSDFNQPQNKPPSDITGCRPTSDCSADFPLSPSHPSSLSPSHHPPRSPSHLPPNSPSHLPPLSPSHPPPHSPSHPPPLSPSHRPTNHDRATPTSSAVGGSLDIRLSIFSNWGHPTHLGLTEVSYCLTRHHISTYCDLASFPASQSPVFRTETWQLRSWEPDSTENLD